MALDFQAMQTEVFARGFDSLNDSGAGLTRVKRWLVEAAHEIDDLDRWPYRMTSTTGTSPITISDLGEIETVYDPASQYALEPRDRGELLRIYGDLTITGTARYFYLNAAAVTVFPVSTVTFTVNYWKVAPDMSANSDTPLMPDRYRSAIVERAVAKAYRDRDDLPMAEACLAESDRIVDRMREQYVLQPGRSAAAVYGYSGDW